MSVRQQANIAYGLSDPLINVPLLPIISNRTPATNDMAAIGTIWVYKPANTAFILTSIVANVATWVQIAAPDQNEIAAAIQTPSDVQTAILTVPLAPNSSVTVSGQIIGARADYSAGLGGTFTTSARREGAAGPVTLGAATIDTEYDGGAGAEIDALIGGNDLIIALTGENVTVWNWKATAVTVTQI